MPIIALEFSAELVNIINLQLADDFDTTGQYVFLQCKDCETLGIIKILPELGNPAPLTAELSRDGKSVILAHFIIEGLKPNKFSLNGNFIATTEDNRKIAIPFNRGQDFEEAEGTGVAVRNMKLGFSIVDSSAASSSST
ncbi:hypothetical protein OWV82_009701 [Melia azedarach]|uniref:Uncharacterized protein n=1 Tax=Melia azedarach TaxID=155640 RepID=A0ACC1Y428_MELAZ|nr:hypothetical protein OWV82_009701 [Melia azedarach]